MCLAAFLPGQVPTSLREMAVGHAKAYVLSTLEGRLTRGSSRADSSTSPSGRRTNATVSRCARTSRGRTKRTTLDSPVSFIVCCLESISSRTLLLLLPTVLDQGHGTRLEHRSSGMLKGLLKKVEMASLR